MKQASSGKFQFFREKGFIMEDNTKFATKVIAEHYAFEDLLKLQSFSQYICEEILDLITALERNSGTINYELRAKAGWFQTLSAAATAAMLIKEPEKVGYLTPHDDGWWLIDPQGNVL